MKIILRNRERVTHVHVTHAGVCVTHAGAHVTHAGACVTHAGAHVTHAEQSKLIKFIGEN